MVSAVSLQYIAGRTLEHFFYTCVCVYICIYIHICMLIFYKLEPENCSFNGTVMKYSSLLKMYGNSRGLSLDVNCFLNLHDFLFV